MRKPTESEPFSPSPPMIAPKSVSLLDGADRPRSAVLSNGLTLVEMPQPHLQRGAISLFFRSGSRYETPVMNGISHFLEHMIFRGTEGYPSGYAQNLAVEALGGTLFAATAPDATEFSLTLPRETAAEGASLLASILARPLFTDIEIERKVIVEEVLEDIDEGGRSIDIDFLSRRRLWPDHPLGQSIAGSLDNVSRFSISDIVAHFQRLYVGANAVLCLSGGYDGQALPEVAAEAFSALPRGMAMPFGAPVTPAPGPTIHHARKPGSQTQVRLAFQAPGEDAPDYTALTILLGVLDDGMSTRLHRRIFDEQGLAYNVGAGLDSYHDASAFNIDVTASHRNVGEVVRQLLALTDGLRSELVPEAEMEKAKRRAIWAMDDYLDDPHGMAAWYGEQALFRTPPSLSEKKAALGRVTADDVLAVAGRVFSKEGLHVTTVGALSRTITVAIAECVDGYR